MSGIFPTHDMPEITSSTQLVYFHDKLTCFCSHLDIASARGVGGRRGRRRGDGRHLVLEETLPISLILGEDLVLGLIVAVVHSDCFSLGGKLPKNAAGRGLLLALLGRLGGIGGSDGNSRDAKCGSGNDELHVADFACCVGLFGGYRLLVHVGSLGYVAS